jgi:hypothetical protein
MAKPFGTVGSNTCVATTELVSLHMYGSADDHKRQGLHACMHRLPGMGYESAATSRPFRWRWQLVCLTQSNHMACIVTLATPCGGWGSKYTPHPVPAQTLILSPAPGSTGHMPWLPYHVPAATARVIMQCTHMYGVRVFRYAQDTAAHPATASLPNALHFFSPL